MSIIKSILRKIGRFISIDTIKEIKELRKNISIKDDRIITIQQKILLASLVKTNVNLSDYGFSMYSESDEDGLLLAVFSVIGFGNRELVDIGAGARIKGSNSANLLLHHNFNGLLIEGSKYNADKLRGEFIQREQVSHIKPKIISEVVSVTNINTLLNNSDFKGEVDLLSIDIDSIDYWIWDSLETIRPRVVVLEYQCILPEDLSLTVPKDFSKTIYKTVEGNKYGIYNSASLKAFEKLADKKGYRLVATSRLGFNAVFILKDLGNEIPSISVKQGLNKPFIKWAQDTFLEETRELKWVEV